jgi:hypothetical protein
VLTWINSLPPSHSTVLRLDCASYFRPSSTSQSKMASRISRVALVLLAAASTVSSLYVVPGSSCAALCLGNSTSTSTESSIDTSDIACKDDDFTSDPKGIKFRNCVECLAKSEEADGENSDVGWMLCKTALPRLTYRLC